MKNKWVVLACFGFAAGLSQMLWLNFAPIISLVEKRYSISESQASLLLLVFPLIYVFLSVHAGAVSDRLGYRAAVVLGAAMMAAFSVLRVYLGSFWILLAAQTGIAIAQPYVVNAISKLVLDWFDRKEEAMATGLGTIGMFFGMAMGLAITPILVEAYGLEAAMAVFAMISVLIFMACYLWVVPNPARKSHSLETPTEFWVDFKKLVRSPQLILVFSVAFLGLGYFNGLTTWLEPILAPHGLSSAQAGIAGGVLILGGIVGAAVFPAISDRLQKRKPVLFSCIVMSVATIYPLTFSSKYSTVLIFSALQGFFFLPSFALLLEICSELAGAKLAGSATGILMLAGNAGGVIVIIAMEWIKGDSPVFDPAVYLMIATLIAAGIGAFKLKETYQAHKTE